MEVQVPCHHKDTAVATSPSPRPPVGDRVPASLSHSNNSLTTKYSLLLPPCSPNLRACPSSRLAPLDSSSLPMSTARTQECPRSNSTPGTLNLRSTGRGTSRDIQGRNHNNHSISPSSIRTAPVRIPPHRVAGRSLRARATGPSIPGSTYRRTRRS